jgi:hypothetical protein
MADETKPLWLTPAHIAVLEARFGSDHSRWPELLKSVVMRLSAVDGEIVLALESPEEMH